MNKLIVSISFLFAWALLNSCSSGKKKVDEEKPVPVTLNKVSGDGSMSYATASGRLVAKNAVDVSTRMMGYITSLKVSVGQKVNAGQILVSINSSDIEAKGGQANAQIAQAQANFNIAKKDYERFENLFKTNSASRKEMDDMQARYEMAKAGLDAARMMRSEVQAQYRYTNISAPISGVITAKYAEQGDMATPGMPLLSIEAPGLLQAQVLVPEADITRIKQGMAVIATLKTTGQQIPGTVSEISLSSTNTGGQYLVKVNLSSSKDLLPGMFVSVQFPFKRSIAESPGSHETVVVPTSALVENGQLKGVYTVSSSNTAVLRWVKTGKVSGDMTEVLSGLNDTESYIVSADGKLFNGVKVKIK
ncbi:MAG: efflux RND transporter periplasmic adaptor subunit [Niabella sp.]